MPTVIGYHDVKDTDHCVLPETLVILVEAQLPAAGTA
jgi:hypothetical protein